MDPTETTPAIEQNGNGESALVPPAPTPEEAEAAEQSPAQSRDSSSIFEFSSFVHVGPGADACEEAETGRCNNPVHFHGWIRLPNQFQQESIQEKAFAGKARKLRVLRDVDSDARTILDGELEELVHLGSREDVIDQIVNQDFLKDHLQAMRVIQEDEKYAHIDEDRERLRALQEMDPDERPEEEYDELQKHVGGYVDAVNEERVRIQQPLRDAVADKPMEELVDLVREARIQGIAQEEFDRVYSLWEWYIGTLKPRPADKGLPQERLFGSVEHLKSAAPEVINALGAAFKDIEAAAGRSLQGAADG